MALIIGVVVMVMVLVELIEHHERHSILITILAIIGGIFMGVMDFTGSTDIIKNKMKNRD